MFGRKSFDAEKQALQQKSARDNTACKEEADSLVRENLKVLDQSLASKREVRAKAASFIGALRTSLKSA